MDAHPEFGVKTSNIWACSSRFKADFAEDVRCFWGWRFHWTLVGLDALVLL